MTRPPTFRVVPVQGERLARVELVASTIFLTPAQLRGVAESLLEMAAQLERAPENSAK